MSNFIRRRWERLSGGKQLVIIAAMVVYFIFGLVYFGGEIWSDGYPTFRHLNSVEWAGALLWFLEALAVVGLGLSPKNP